MEAFPLTGSKSNGGAGARPASDTHYDVLGVDRKAAHDEIRRAYLDAGPKVAPRPCEVSFDPGSIGGGADDTPESTRPGRFWVTPIVGGSTTSS